MSTQMLNACDPHPRLLGRILQDVRVPKRLRAARHKESAMVGIRGAAPLGARSFVQSEFSRTSRNSVDDAGAMQLNLYKGLARLTPALAFLTFVLLSMPGWAAPILRFPGPTSSQP